jgi:hypothetical protein
VDETSKLWMKVHLFIQICVFSSKKEGYHLEIGSNVANSSTDISPKIPSKKKNRHFGELLYKKKSLGAYTGTS